MQQIYITAPVPVNGLNTESIQNLQGVSWFAIGY